MRSSHHLLIFCKDWHQSPSHRWFVQELARNGAPWADVQQLGKWWKDMAKMEEHLGKWKKNWENLGKP
jgi:hypothetical protein